MATKDTLSISYVISPVTLYDNDEQLYYTKVGLKGKNMDLLYTCWGKSASESRVSAEKLMDILG